MSQLGADPGAVDEPQLVGGEVVEVEAQGDELDLVVEVEGLEADGRAAGLVADGGEEGVEVESVTPGGAAEKAGVQGGDRIVEIAGLPVKNIGEYMKAMAVQKKGTTIEITLERGGKKVKVKVPLE